MCAMQKRDMVLGGVAIGVAAVLLGTASWAAATHTGTVPASAAVAAPTPAADAGRPKAQSAPPVAVAQQAPAPQPAPKTPVSKTPVSKTPVSTTPVGHVHADADPAPVPSPTTEPAPDPLSDPGYEGSLSPTSWFHYVPARPMPIVPVSVTPPKEPGFQISLANPNVPYDPVTNPHPYYVFYKGCQTRTAECEVSGLWGDAGY